MIYAPRATRHLSPAAAEARAQRTERAVQRLVRQKTAVASAHAPAPRAVHGRFVLRLWLPLTLVFLLLAPFALLLAPCLYFAPPAYRHRPFATVLGVGAALLSLGGTLVEVDTPEALVRIRIF